MDRMPEQLASKILPRLPRAVARKVRNRLRSRRVLHGVVQPTVASPKMHLVPTFDTSKPHCMVCGSHKLSAEPLARPDRPRTLTAISCDRCRYVHIPENHREYEVATTTANLGGGKGARMGTWEKPGREFKMAKLAIEILARKNLTVLMYGAGQSIDNHHVAQLARVSRVVIGDLVKTRNDAEFIDISELATEQFDVVVASEVLEHFPDPYANFENLFSYVKKDGLIVCGTNIRDGLPIHKVNYIWCGGHVSYWSPKALRRIAAAFKMHVDYRLPLNVTGRGGPRKRYIFFSPSRKVMDSLADWFGSHAYAPSEEPWAEKHTKPARIPASPDQVPLGKAKA